MRTAVRDERYRFARHMSDEDALMWNIEKDPVLRSTIVAVGVLDQPPDWQRLRARDGYKRAVAAETLAGEQQNVARDF